MYCSQCGVKLNDSEKLCPLCGTRAYHPDIVRDEGDSLYPKNEYREPKPSKSGLQLALTVACVIALITVHLCDMQISGAITWSGYVTGAVLVGYVTFILPLWFSRPNPVIFVPCSFAAVALFVLYICLSTGGSWFLPFALPVVGGMCVIVTTVAALLRYVRRGRLYIIGGAMMALGGISLLCELLMMVTFERVRFIGWSLYPLLSMFLIGGFLIFLAICRPARESMERKFFF